MREIPPLPIPVKRALIKVGQDIRNARRRRRIPMKLMAERASISRTTLTKVERGDPSVSFGIYTSVLFVLGLLSNLVNLCDWKRDEVGGMFDEKNLPQRIRLPQSPQL